jgi:hypothetical protein
VTPLALGIAAYAVAFLIFPDAGGDLRADRMARMPIALIAHVGGSLLALAIGPFQLHKGLRSRMLDLHRLMGRAYLLAVLVGGLGGLWLAAYSDGGMVAHLGFGALAVLWLWTTAMAFIRIRVRDLVSHREWMIRSFALTLAAVTLRIYLPVSLLSGVEFLDAYPVIAWACWVPNLLIAEAVIRSGRVKRVLSAA